MEPSLGERLAARRNREGTSCGWLMPMVGLAVGWLLLYHTYGLQVQPGDVDGGDAAAVVRGVPSHRHDMSHHLAKGQLIGKQPTRSAGTGPGGTVAQLAFVTYCVKTNTFGNDFGRFEYYDQCLASICSLLGTTDPEHVVVLIDGHFPAAARHTLEAQGVQVVNIDHEEVTQWQQSSRYPAIANADYPRLAPFVKLIAWKMVQYENIFYLDADTEIRSNLTEYFLTLPKGRDAVISNVTTHRCNSFFNAGVMVMRPSQRMYDALMSIWRAGSFRHNFAEDDDEGCETQRASAEAKHYPGGQNVLIEYFTGGADRYHVLDPCYNYRGRVSEQESCGQCAGQECDDRVKVLHIAKLLKWMDMSTWQVHSWRGTCRTVPLPIRRRKGVI